MHISDLSTIFPTQSIENGMIVNGNGDITFGMTILLPQVFTYSKNNYIVSHDAIISTFKELPAGTIIQKQDYFYQDYFEAKIKEEDHYVKRANLSYYDARPVLKHHSYYFFTFKSSTNKDKGFSLTSFADVLFKKPFKDFEKVYPKIEQYKQMLLNSFNSLEGIKAYPMDDTTLGNAIHNYFNLTYFRPVVDFTQEPFERVMVDKDTIKIGNQYVSVGNIEEEADFDYIHKLHNPIDTDMINAGLDYKDNFGIPACMVYPLALGLPINHIINTTIEIVDSDKFTTDAEKGDYETKILATFSSVAKHKNDRLLNYKQQITEKGKIPVKLGFSIILHHANLDTLLNLQSIVKNQAAKGIGSRIVFENLMNFHEFCCGIPGNSALSNRRLQHLLDRAVCYLNMETHYVSDSNGHLYLDRYGNPVVVNMWNSPYINNRNKVVFGPSGSGKSHYLNGYVDSSLNMGNHIIIIDAGGSYKTNALVNNGFYFDTASSSNLQFNIFICQKDDKGCYIYQQGDEDGEGTNDQIEYVYTILKTIWKKEREPSPEESQILRDMIVAFYERINKEKKFPDFDRFYEFITTYYEDYLSESEKKFIQKESILLLLKPFYSGTNGMYKYLLNSKKDIPLKNYQYIVFDLEGVKDNKELRDVIAIIIINVATNKIERSSGVKKTLLIDEAIDYLTGDIGNFIGGMYRKIRKRNGEVIIATQGISYLDEINPLTRKSIFTNTDTKILLSHKGSDQAVYDLFRKYLDFSEDDIELLNSLQSRDDKNYREFLMKQGHKMTRIFRNQVSNETQAIYTTTTTEMEKLSKLMKENKENVFIAINQFVEEKRKNHFIPKN